MGTIKDLLNNNAAVFCGCGVLFNFLVLLWVKWRETRIEREFNQRLREMLNGHFEDKGI